jgi:uncharacterized phage protein gp47/JayE
MTYAVEPYSQFVDDLLTALTGGTIREDFRFLAEQAPYKLTAAEPVVPASVRVFGLARGAFARFQRDRDFTLGDQNTIDWRAQTNGTPAADAVLPDTGSVFYVNYETVPEFIATPRLTDRNVGSVTRLLAESVAREFAVLSGQLQAVYRAAFLDTATNRDLDNLAGLVGISRRGATFAAGSVVFGRSSPAPADIFVPAGTRLSTLNAPVAVFETTETRTLRRGELSVEAPIAALAAGGGGVVSAGTIGVLNRPILGIETVQNPLATRFAASAESDASLRARARRGLEGAGKATTGALVGVLAGLPGMREKDVLVSEDPIARPGIVEIKVALPEMKEEERVRTAARAVELIEATRPVGVRVVADIDAPRPPGQAEPGVNPGEDADDAPAVKLSKPVDIQVQLAPASLALTPVQREDLRAAGKRTVHAFVAEAGIGETLVYNRLVAQLMAINGVMDVSLEWQEAGGAAVTGQPKRKNLVPRDVSLRPVAGVITVELGGALIMLDMAVTVVPKEVGTMDAQTTMNTALAEIETQLRNGLRAFAGPTLTTGALKSMLVSSTYDLPDLHYKVEYQDAGVRIHQQDVELPLTGLEKVWIRSVSLLAGSP